MPTYGYRCQKCGEEFDVVHKFADGPATECIKCGGPVKRLFHPVGIIFKGSGFYTTDYARKSTKPAPSETKSETKSESKSESKSDKTDSKEKPKDSSKPLEKAST